MFCVGLGSHLNMPPAHLSISCSLSTAHTGRVKFSLYLKRKNNYRRRIRRSGRWVVHRVALGVVEMSVCFSLSLYSIMCKLVIQESRKQTPFSLSFPVGFAITITVEEWMSGQGIIAVPVSGQPTTKRILFGCPKLVKSIDEQYIYLTITMISMNRFSYKKL